MKIKIVNDYSNFITKLEEPLFLNPDGVRTRFPIGWEGKGRYIPESLKLYRASDNTLIDPATYAEESNGIFFNFTSAPASGNYTDIIVKYFVNKEDYAFAMGTSDSGYPGEEYFLFPNWNNAKGCGDAFWVGKYAASRADATTSSQGTSNTPVSKKNKCSWVNTTWANQVASCATKGTGFHCIRNREYVAISHWVDKMNPNILGNNFGYINNGSDIDGQGTNISASMVDLSANPTEKPSGTYVKILTGAGPATFRHNGRIDGISDLSGNVWEAVDGLQLRNGVPYILDENNTNYVALNSSDIVQHHYDTYQDVYTIQYINNRTDDIINEGLPVASAGLSVTGGDCYYMRNTNTRICYRGGFCNNGAGAGVWALALSSDSSGSAWFHGFRLARTI